MNKRIIITAALLILAPMTAQAEQEASQEAGPTITREQVERRLENDMLKMPNMVEALSKNLGQLHYMRRICFGKSDQTWRKHANTMMDIEATHDSDRRAKLIIAFNQGFYEQQARFTSCSQDVSIEAAAIAENGRHLANMLGDPYRE